MNGRAIAAPGPGLRISRRRFVRLVASAVAVTTTVTPCGAAGAMPRRRLGSTGLTVSLLGLGGSRLGAPSLTDKEAVRLIRTAIDSGVDFLDNAREYQAGKSEERMGRGLAGGWRDRVFLMTKNCAHDRSDRGSMRSLEASLKALGTDHVDLWLFHEVVHPYDPAWIFERGALAAAVRARTQGKVRFIGFSGHKSPSIHLDMLRRSFRWDAVMMPLNVLDAHFDSFERQVLPELGRRRIGAIAMKSLGGFSSRLLSATGLEPADCLRYVMSLPVSTVVVGMESLELLRVNLGLARRFAPLSASERAAILAASQAASREGLLERYKTAREFDGVLGQDAHRPER